MAEIIIDAHTVIMSDDQGNTWSAIAPVTDLPSGMTSCVFDGERYICHVPDESINLTPSAQ